MPSLACRICGRVVYTTAAFDTLFAEESRCPRCGGILWPERRVANRRGHERRAGSRDTPGAAPEVERRGLDRRQGDRRRNENRSA
jgi:hypothetical protein